MSQKSEALKIVDEESVIKRLSHGVWLIDDLLPLFRQQLIDRLGNRMISNVTTSALTSLLFRKIQIPESRSSGTPNRFVPHESVIFWNQHIRIVSPEAQVVSATDGFVSAVNEACELIQTQNAISGILNTIDLFLSIETKKFRSASHPHFWGCLFLNEDQPAQPTAVSIIHEMAHQELFLLNTLDRLINSSNDFSLVHSPFQGKARPPIGRLHSAHALFRMVQFKRLVDLPYASDLDTLAETVKTFSDSEMTHFGRRLVHEVYSCRNLFN